MKIYEKKNYNRILSYNKLLKVTVCLNKLFNNCKVVPLNQIFGILTSEEIIKKDYFENCAERIVFKTQR